MSTFRISALILVAASASVAGANVRFAVVDPTTHAPIDALVTLADSKGRWVSVATSVSRHGITHAFDASLFEQAPDLIEDTTIVVEPGVARNVTVRVQSRDPQVPTKEITIKVTATRLVQNRSPLAAAGTTRTKEALQKFVNTSSSDSRNLTKGQSGVAEDSAGQQHVRGEHADISYVVDGVPIPDSLSGRQGSIVVPSTIQSLEILTGGFAPEFGGQTAAILNVTTLPRSQVNKTEANLQFGSFNAVSADLTSVGPLGKNLGYVFTFNANRTNLGLEPPQPNNPTAHNRATNEDAFGKIRWTPSVKDTYTLTLSRNPDTLQIANRTGLPISFGNVGQGFGLFGQRNADGSRPDGSNGGLGSGLLQLPSQDQSGQRIDQTEIGEFGVFSFDRKVNARDNANLALTILHSGQEVTNSNPAVDLFNLPVDNSIEFNPQAIRNVHQLQLSGNYSAKRGGHQVKLGFLLDAQSGVESYQVTPASQLALDALAAIAPSLAPSGSASTERDVNGNPVYTPSGGQSPTLRVERQGTYRAAFLQDTWQISKRFAVNYGLRGDWFNQNQNLGQPAVSTFELSPRFNFQYKMDSKTELRWAFNHLFNTPPLAQGAVVGQAIQPEVLNQYDIGVTHQLGHGQSLGLAYYYKQIRNQTDTGLLIPGSQIGLYSAVSLARGGVHGIELSYILAAPKGVGWDSYLNYSYGAAKPNGTDNTGQPVGDYNDHDQRQTVGFGLAYTLKSGASAAITVEHGSGLASSVINVERTPRTDVGLHLGTGDRLWNGHGGLSFDVQNLFDSRDVINFQSAFSGTRFQIPRRISIQASYKF